MEEKSLRVNYDCLVAAVVKQAAEDYKHAVKYMYKHFGKIIREEKDCYDASLPYKYYCKYGYINRMKGFQIAQNHIAECEYFFDNCVMTNRFHPGELTSFLQQEALDELKNPNKLRNKSRGRNSYNYFMEDLMCGKDDYSAE